MSVRLILGGWVVGMCCVCGSVHASSCEATALSLFQPFENINSEKIRSVSTHFEKRVVTDAHAMFVCVKSSRLADRCRKEPVLFVVLALFVSVSLIAFGFVVHLLRSDPRFS